MAHVEGAAGKIDPERFATIVYETVEPKIRRLTLNRPNKLNALSGTLLEELELALDLYAADDDASILIIRGSGRAFCAGFDLAETASGGVTTITQERWFLRKTVERWQRLFNHPKPILAQVHGYCLSGGTELASHCDLIFASDDAEFGHPAGRTLGEIPTLSLWPILMGPQRAKELLFTGDSMSAQQAYENGFINRVIPRDELEDAVMAYARRVALVSPDMLTIHKGIVNRFMEIMGLYAAEFTSADYDAIGRFTPTAQEQLRKMIDSADDISRVVHERDAKFDDD